MNDWDLLNMETKKNYRLYVMIASRDRSIMTLKTINSILENSPLFEDIRIYIYDNLSEITPERIKLFSDLLQSGKIKYYSYDTKESLTNCFAKAISFNRWIWMMDADYHIRSVTEKRPDLKSYYLLLDNDMLLGKGWDEHFISVGEQITSVAPTVRYITKFPGGVPKASRDRSGENYNVKNIFKSNENIEVMTADFGGGSGFWFMDIEQLNFLRWELKEFVNTYNCFKKHDTTTWNMLEVKNKGENYVCIVKPKEPDENPLVLHMGGVVGSMCNILTRNREEYPSKREEFRIKEESIKDMSTDEIFEKYKGTDCKIW